MFRSVLLFLFEMICCGIFAQIPDGPGGVGSTSGTSTLRLWLRPEMGVTLNSGFVSAWADQSGYGNNLSAAAGFRPVTATSASMNGQTIMRYSGAQYFSSALSGPGVNDMTLFLACNGSSYQSLFRFQNTAGTYLVYPWELGGTPRVFISSSDGGTGSGVASGLVSNVNNIGGARYRRNTTNGMQTYLNGAVNAQRNSVNAVLPSQPFYSGRYNPGSGEYPTCDVGDMILYYEALNDAQMIIVQNYLAAKYNVTLSSNDLYTMDNAANGNFDYDVAGIGRVNGSNLHDDAQGTGIVRILNPSGLGNGEYYLWGHDNGTLQASTADSPTGEGVQSRLQRVWRGSEVGTIISFDLRFDLSGLGPITAGDLRLLIDTDNDGTFANETVAGGGVVSGASLISGSIYQFSAVTGLNNNIRFTLGTANVSATPLPIKLIDFSARQKNETVELSWKTASEKNNAYFEVERSVDALEFKTVARVPSKSNQGNSLTTLDYTCADTDPIEGLSYYRLRQVDLDESVTVYKLIAVNYVDVHLRLLLYPNPGKGELNFSFSGIEGANEMRITIVNEAGKQVLASGPYKVSSLGNILTLKTSGILAPGIYYCLIDLDATVHSLQVVVQ